MTLSVKEVMKKWLANRGYQGLCSEDCGCDIDDLFPCGEYCGACRAAYRFECERCDRKNCDRRNDDYGVLFSDDKDFCKPVYGGKR